MSKKVRELFNWALTVLQSSYQGRLKVVRQIEKDVKTWGSLNDEPTQEGQALCEGIVQNRDYEVFGIVPNIAYIRVQGSEEERQALFVHAFGDPVLLYRHRKTGVLVILGASMHFDESLIEKVPFNRARGYFSGPKKGIIG